MLIRIVGAWNVDETNLSLSFLLFVLTLKHQVTIYAIITSTN